MTGRARAEAALSEAGARQWRIDVPMVSGDLRTPRPWTANERIHWRVRHDRTKTIRTAVTRTARALKIPLLDHVRVQLHYAPGDNRRRDEDNLTTTSKPSFDGLVDAGIVPDDTAAWMTKLMPVIHPGRGRRQLWLVVEAVDAPMSRPIAPVSLPRGAPGTHGPVSRDPGGAQKQSEGDSDA